MEAEVGVFEYRRQLKTREVGKGYFFGGEEVRKHGLRETENLERNRGQEAEVGRVWVRI